jgi:adenylate cyclase
MVDPSDILRGKILIVDDQPANVALLDQMLRRAGYLSISSTTNSEKVCELHLVNRYDLILLDLQMPGMDGFQVMENLKEIETGSYLPVLVITAQPAHKLRALSSGAKDFVSKPFDVAEVLIRVRNMLEVRLLHMEARKLYERVLEEKKVSERLLRSALPPSIADRLNEHVAVTPDVSSPLVAASYAEVTMLFADIVEFTKFSEGTSANLLIGVLNDISARYDNLEHRPDLNRKKTTGDAYRAAVELPTGVADRSMLAVHKAFDLTEALDRFNAHSRYKLRVRIGIESSDSGSDSPKVRKRLYAL